MADDLVSDLVALLENLHDAAALLPFGGGDLLDSESESLKLSKNSLRLSACLQTHEKSLRLHLTGAEAVYT